MRIGQRLGLGFSLVLLPTIVVAILSLWTYHNIHVEFVQLRDDIVPGALAMAEMSEAVGAAAHRTMDYVVTGEREYREETRRCLKRLRTAAQAHLEHETHMGAEERSEAGALSAEVKSYASAIEELLSLKGRGLPAAEILKREDEIAHPLMHSLAVQLDKHKATHLEKLAAAEIAVHAAHDRGRMAVVVSAGAMLAGGVLVILLVTRSLIKPVEKLRNAAALAGEGRLDVRVGSSARDEIGEVSRTFDLMADRLGQAYATLERKVADRTRALAEERERLRVTIASIGDGVIAVDADGRVTLINDVAQELTGYSADEATGRPLAEVFTIVNERTREPAPDPAAKAVREGRIVGLANHTVLIARDGTQHAIADSAAPIRDESGETIGVVLVFRDVTEERKAQNEIRRLATIAEQASEGVVTADLDGVVSFVNPAWARMHGYETGEELVGKHLSTFHTEEQMRTEIGPLLEDLEAADGLTSEVGHVRNDGTTFPAQLTTGLLRDEEGRQIGLAGFAIDITERKRAEEALRSANRFQQQLLDVAATPVFTVDAERCITSVNEAFCAITGGHRRTV